MDYDWLKRIVGAAMAVGVIIGGYVGYESFKPEGIPDGFVYAVDSSYAQLTEAAAYRLKEQGVVLYVQALTAFPYSGLHQPTNRVISLRNAHSAGLAIAGYALVGDLSYGGRASTIKLVRGRSTSSLIKKISKIS